MRLIVAGFVVLTALTASAQDAATMAAQQAAEASQQAMQDAQQASQQATQAAQQANQQAMQDAQIAAQASEACCHVAKPKFSMKPGSYSSPVTLSIEDSSRGTYIYYSTDGWTPTVFSRRYKGPITISSTTMLQAIAVDAKNNRSSVVTAVYTIAGSSPHAPSTTFPASAQGEPILLPGTQLPLIFTSSVSSKGLKVGDSLPVALAQDLTLGGVLVASKGTPVSAKVTQVDNSGVNGLPGTLTFQVHSMQLNDGTTLLLSATRTKEGQSRMGTADGVGLIPLGGLFVRGKEARIPSGASLIARVRSVTTHHAQIDASSAGNELP
jgi:chitobiase/beta-hexosaminidase-like protein